MAKPLIPQRTRLSKGMRKELFRNSYEIQHDISLVFASIVLLAWEGKNECPSHMTLLYQQKLCRNNYADEDFVGLVFIIQKNPTDSTKTPPSSWAVSRADIQKILSPCAHISTLPQLPAIFSFEQSLTCPCYPHLVHIARSPIILYQLFLTSCTFFFLHKYFTRF